ncbi:SMI1/KNR4 family protein [Myroides marinus]|uniref:SMI1/KNR4 family protein n=1 Tax=Myroides marinus TaxID=703342 RepID=UPI002577F5AA|nr:SMI1/KNR4 family protein [Myroides marinus]MDM1352128.1 SMI1/KNR4 family protein [Myroides marinus]MDM1359330.1 SMI1/KNR4 family protein [Myroides marinus]MDM1362424.1 SMI1/KNR4 family protein [Myroides marinus]MDM1370110.1 SMI1/KNR4 family protein [Myroides marinus]MDM1373704.1 SMI1/KNR4 family protein [Myroides marinus]
MKNTSKKISTEEMIDFSNHFEKSIPLKFKELYLEYNGGIPNKKYIYDYNNENYLEIKVFLSIKYKNGSNPIIEEYISFLNKNSFNNLLPFALDWGGNIFAIDLITERVCLLLLDLSSKIIVNTITDNFSDFIDELEVEESYEE